MALLSLKNSTSLGLLALTLAVSAWSILLSRQATVPLNTHIHQADASMENVVATIMNKEGTPALKVQAPKMVHIVQNDTTLITQPHVTVFRESPAPWYIDADSAEATHGITQITFLNNVIIHHPVDTANPVTTLKTTSLTLFPDKQQAKTEAPVTILQPDMIVHAIGMLANLNSGTVELLSQAEGSYVPAS